MGLMERMLGIAAAPTGAPFARVNPGTTVET